MTEPVLAVNVFIAIGLVFVIGVIAVIVIEATNEGQS